MRIALRVNAVDGLTLNVFEGGTVAVEVARTSGAVPAAATGLRAPGFANRIAVLDRRR